MTSQFMCRSFVLLLHYDCCIIYLLALAMVFRALPFLNHSIWPALKVWDSLISNGLPSLGLTTMVMGLPGSSSVALMSTYILDMC